MTTAASILQDSTHVVIETAPIRSSSETKWFPLVAGILLALHTPAWLLVVFYQESDETNGKSVLRTFLSKWLLEFVPWFANAGLSFFLGILFLYMGAAVWDGEKQINKKTKKD